MPRLTGLKIARRRFHSCHAKFNVLEKTRRNFFVIEKQSSEEEMQPMKKNFCVCFVFSTCKENEVSLRWLINYKSAKDKKFYFRETCF